MSAAQVAPSPAPATPLTTVYAMLREIGRRVIAEQKFTAESDQLPAVAKLEGSRVPGNSSPTI
jgi:hypothetical protein